MTATTRIARALGPAWALLVLIAAPAPAEAWRVKVQGQGTDLGATPVVAALKAPLPPGPYTLQAEGGKPLPAQVFVDAGRSYLGTVLDRVAGSTPETYTLKRSPSGADSSSGIALRREEGGNIAVTTGGKPFTVYRTDAGPKPFYFPVVGPTGVSFTRAYPMMQVEGEDKDHPHQRSMWFTHGKVNGIDFWSELKGHGSIKETSRATVDGGPALGVIRTTDEWLAPDGKKVCDDERVVRFYDAGATRLIDFEITLKATAGPVVFGDTKEGMFGVRVASSMDVKAKKGGKITNAEGITDDPAWGKASPWVDYTGPVAGRTVGVAILNHPDSFRYPTTWHVRNYGLFAANPFGWHDFGQGRSGEYTLPAGESIRFAYRVILHEGDTPSAHIPAAFDAYAKPPRVEVEAD
jgi:hypothetical protein